MKFTSEDGIFFVAGGVFYFFKEQQLREILKVMAGCFPGGELYFDAESRKAVEKSNSMIKKTGNKGAMMYFYVNDAKKFESWSSFIKLASCEGYFKGIPFNKQWALQTPFDDEGLDAYDEICSSTFFKIGVVGIFNLAL